MPFAFSAFQSAVVCALRFASQIFVVSPFPGSAIGNNGAKPLSVSHILDDLLAPIPFTDMTQQWSFHWPCHEVLNCSEGEDT